MKRRHVTLTFLFTAAVVILLSAGGASAQDHKDFPSLDCTKCHTCNDPTIDEPCLKPCPRIQSAHETAKHSLTEAPDSMLLNSLENLYEPVRFNHKLHASMAEMGADCATCHHYSPPGEIQPCSDCHSQTAESTDLSKPNLKGAYHRQCLSCHREWSHDTKCVVCHIPREGGAIAESISDPTDIMGTRHPVITEPVKRVYTTPYKPGPIVTFHHMEHIELFNLRCVDCHKKEDCGYCHDLEQKTIVKKTQAQVHAVCNDCHADDRCAKCHDNRERPAFVHADTGWPMNRFHRGLECRACHPTGTRIAKLNTDCNACHSGWNETNFSHAITGLLLDETHSEIECETCHLKRNFAVKPVCTECHDDGRTYDETPPGEFVKVR